MSALACSIDRRRLLSLAVATTLPASAFADALSLARLPGEVAAPEFELSDLSGTPHRLSAYRGRPVLVNFWAVWCPPCRRELAALADLRARGAGDGIEVLAVNLGDSAERVVRFLVEHPAPGLPVLLDIEKTSARAWHVPALPVGFAVDRAGILRFGALGERDWRFPEIERQLRSLLSS
jgi:thiol-disulfide isomerase/thioredoxin